MKEQNILVLKFGFFDPLKKMELLGKFGSIVDQFVHACGTFDIKLI